MSKPSEEAKNIWGKIAHDAVSGVPAGKCMQEGALAIDALVQRKVEEEREKLAASVYRWPMDTFGSRDAIAAALRATPNTGG